MNKVLLSPHSDDETLFAAYAIMQHRPLVVVVYDSYIQVQRGVAYCDARTRRGETHLAMIELLGTSKQHVFLGLRDDTKYTPHDILQAISPYIQPDTELWAPLWEENGHDQHNLVAMAASAHTGIVHRYTTYTRIHGRTRLTDPSLRVDPTPDMIARKLRAKACYTSQITHPSCRPWFTGDLEEYVVD